MNGPRRINVEWLIVAVNGVTLASVVGAWLWWGGRFSERMDNAERQIQAHDTAIIDIRATDGKQNSDLAVGQAQFQTIINELTVINNKLDSRDLRR